MGVNELALVQSPKGFHILKVMDKRGDVNLPKELSSSIQQTHARHILIKINQLVSAEEAKIRLSKLKQRIEHNEATFEELAKSNSNDLSASKGGDLGWIYPGDTVPEFERAMNALKIGEISDPVESPFGFHIIQVLERQTNAASKERLSAVAKQAIIARKSREATDEWLQQLRDSTYVEYRLEEAK